MFSLRTTCAIIIQVTFCLWVITGAIEPVGQPPPQKVIRGSSKLPMELPANIQCPEPGKISPCECYVNWEYSMFMDCSSISSEEELSRVFNQEFPFTNFKQLKILSNENLKFLRAGDLGNASFIDIYISQTTLSEIEDLALISSSDTLEHLDLHNNNLVLLPDISPFKRLASLMAYENALTVFPTLNSSSLACLNVATNRIRTLPVEAIYGLPSLTSVMLENNFISSILSGTFANNPKLDLVQWFSNNLTTLPKDAIKLHGPSGWLDLSDNQITYLPPGSFSGVTSVMRIRGNLMTELDEQIWRPLLEGEVHFCLKDNPFVCGCDIAWLITNRTLLDRVQDIPTCYNGTAFVDLDPVYYLEEC